MMKTKLHAAWRRINAFFPKKLLASGLCALVLLGSPAQAPGINQTPSEDMLRLHVVAASDLPEDQRIKLCVRDAVQTAYAEHAKESASMLENTRTMLSALQAAAEQAARAEGYHGPVTVSLEQVSFDERKLDGLTFPAGIYPALMVRLGPAQGHNWWGLVDRELALASAQVPDDAGTTLWEQGEIRWTLLLPQLLCRWFGGEGTA